MPLRLSSSPRPALPLHNFFLLQPKHTSLHLQHTLSLCVCPADRIGEDGVKTMLKPGVYAISLPGFQRARAQQEEYEEEEAEEADEAEAEAEEAQASKPKAKAKGGMDDDEEEEEEDDEEEEDE